MRESVDVESCQLGDILAVDIEMERFFVQTCALTLGAHGAGGKLPAPFLLLVRAVFISILLYKLDQTVVGSEIVHTRVCAVGKSRHRRAAVENLIYNLIAQFFKRSLDIIAVGFKDSAYLKENQRFAIFA